MAKKNRKFKRSLRPMEIEDELAQLMSSEDEDDEEDEEIVGCTDVPYKTPGINSVLDSLQGMTDYELEDVILGNDSDKTIEKSLISSAEHSIISSIDDVMVQKSPSTSNPTQSATKKTQSQSATINSSKTQSATNIKSSNKPLIKLACKSKIQNDPDIKHPIIKSKLIASSTCMPLLSTSKSTMIQSKPKIETSTTSAIACTPAPHLPAATLRPDREPLKQIKGTSKSTMIQSKPKIETSTTSAIACTPAPHLPAVTLRPDREPLKQIKGTSKSTIIQKKPKIETSTTSAIACTPASHLPASTLRPDREPLKQIKGTSPSSAQKPKASILVHSNLNASKVAVKYTQEPVSPRKYTTESATPRSITPIPVLNLPVSKPKGKQLNQNKLTAQCSTQKATASIPVPSNNSASKLALTSTKASVTHSKPTAQSSTQTATASILGLSNLSSSKLAMTSERAPVIHSKPSAQSFMQTATASIPGPSKPALTPEKVPVTHSKPIAQSSTQTATASITKPSSFSVPKLAMMGSLAEIALSPVKSRISQSKPTIPVSASIRAPCILSEHSYSNKDVGARAEVEEMAIDSVLQLQSTGQDIMDIDDSVEYSSAPHTEHVDMNIASCVGTEPPQQCTVVQQRSTDTFIEISPAQDVFISTFETLEQIKNKRRVWSSNDMNQVLPKFTKTMTNTKHYTNRSVPVDYFINMFPEEIFELLAENTNKYAEFMYALNWKPTNSTEIRAYLGMIILMGVHPLPEVELYWSSDPFFNNPIISSVMPVRRFKKITENLHINDKASEIPRGEEGYDKLCKIKPIMNILNQTFPANCTQSQSQSIDESMVKFKGRSSMKQYMPAKPIKRGYKIWARCDASTGYLYQFSVYTGKAVTVDDGDGGLGYNVVMELCKNVQPNTLLAFDNFFTGLPLMEMLYQKNIFAVGTIRPNRKGIPEIITKKSKETKLDTGEFMVQCAPPLSLIKWRDTKDVLVCTTAFNPKEVVTIKRTQKDGSKKPMTCPLTIAEYTKNMGGVDRLDHFRSSYSIGRKSKRNWLRLFWFMVEVASINAYIIYTQTHDKINGSHRDFRVSLGRGLINNFSVCIRQPTIYKNKKGGVFGVSDTVRLANVGVHMPHEGTRRRCRYCSTRAQVHRTTIMCVTCQVPLCITPCFSKFHK